MKKNFVKRVYSLYLKYLLRTMRLFLLLFFVGIHSIFAETYSQETRLSLHLKNVSIEELFQEIEKSSEYLFFYKENVPKETRVSVDAEEETLDTILNKVLTEKNIDYHINDRQVVVALNPASKKVLPQPIPQQIRKTITGTVMDQHGEPVIGANVVEKGTTNGVITNIDGEFTLSVSENAVIQFSYIGYITQEQSTRNQANVNIVLKEDTQGLEEVVVIGYGTVKRGNLTTAVTSLQPEVIQNRPAQSISDVLQGTVAGLTVTSNGGKPGSSATMRLRGSTSLNDEGSPLILVDGVPGEFNFLNVDDIENITVLKDAASAAIYGSRAAHGVILVTTKRGKSGKPTFRYNGYVGINTPTNMPKSVSSAEYARIRNESQANIGRAPVYSEEEIGKFASGTDPDRYPNTDWIDLMFQNSYTTRHSLAATGGSENVRYYLGGGFDKQTGVIDEVSQDVFNIRSNVDANVTKKLTLSFDLRYVLRKKDEVQGLSGIITDIYKMNPTYLAYYTDGSYAYNPNSIINPIAYLYETGHEKYDVHDGSGIFKMDYEFIPGLKFTGIANVNYVFYNTKSFGRTLYFKDYFTEEVITRGQNTLTQKSEHKTYYNLQALLTYKKSFGEHNLDVLAGYQQENEKKSWFSAYREGFPTDIVHELAGGPKENWSNDGNGQHWSIASFIARVNYDYAGKYLLTFNMRSDGSSRFAKDNRWSTFPSVAAAWRISGEEFMTGTSSFLNDLKIRASWGTSGASSGLGLYPSYTTIGMRGAVLNNSYRQTAYLSSLGNKDLNWEKTNMFDIGFDALLLDSRLGVTFDYYNKDTKEILIGLPVPMEYGFSKPKVNIGKVRNRGWEVDLKWNDRIGEVSYQIQGNISDNRNKVLDIGGTAPWISGSSYTTVGKPMNSIYGYEATGLFQSQDEIDNSPFQNVQNKPGDVKYKDQNKDGKIDGDDRVIIGSPHPRYLFGLRLAAEYKGFDFSMFFHGVGKKDYIMSGPGIQPLSDAGKGPVFTHQLNYWTEDNPNAKYPRMLDSGQGSFNYQTSDFWKINAGYLRLKNVQLGYNFSKGLLKQSGFENIRLFLTATNLFTIDNFIPGYDPETSNAYTYPLARTYSLGVNLQF